ncbi:MAG: WxcM-like domain-containing protein [Rhodoferax sp.]|uniref:WxcM-like domain-containing protein n=1 Tax=Rhodoferax sp. TaxID=50421 RepID=UPI00263922F3|nr:WxcM-like domain-containing protein [Rhodoferax sp.]MDD2881507.1 WxcM-like domain-containing protein [Rhodoferax sp.]
MTNFFVHKKALCESTNVGKGTRIWAFAHVLPGAVIGCDCNLCDGVFIENDVVVGDRVTIKCGVQLWDGLQVEDDVFIGPNVTFSNDRFPRSKAYPEKYERTIVRKGASIGANATLLPGIEIGSDAMVGAGAVVTRTVPPNAIAVGNPARIVGYVGSDAPVATAPALVAGVTTSHVNGVTLHELPHVRDMRGSLSVGEFDRSIPFAAKRYFLVFDVPSREVRGEHAHHTCHQFLICVRGSCAVVADDGTHRCEFILDRPNLGIYLPPMTWGTQYKYSADAVLLVFASDFYNAADYIRDYGVFKMLSLKAR